ncbi:hypothetical protein [Nocardia sp. NPDC004604]|uniref:hypothetical protein n=1 Tax=Nocardia sp. NPDC004604 TaxID=3157013 RepID=UPI0033B1C2B2
MSMGYRISEFQSVFFLGFAPITRVPRVSLKTDAKSTRNATRTPMFTRYHPGGERAETE